MMNNQKEYYTYTRKDGSRAIFTEKEDYDTFMRALKRTDIDIDQEVDIWITYIDKRLSERGLDEYELKLFYKRFIMAF